MHGLGLTFSGNLGNAMADVADGIQARHILLLQEVDRVALTLREQGNQDIGPGDLTTPGRLDMHGGAVERALEACGGFGLDEAIHDQTRKFMIDEVLDLLANAFDIDATGTHDRNGIIILGQCEKEMLKRCVLVLALVC